MAPPEQVTPEVSWAQRSSSTDASKNIIYLTIMAPDVSESKTKLEITPTRLTFSGYSDTKKVTYHVELDLYGEIETEAKLHHTARDVELVLTKKKLETEYWPRLLKDKAKAHFLKTNFDKWVDEDEQNVVPDEPDYGGMGGMPGMGAMGGMGGMGGDDGGFGGIDFSKLGGGAGGMGGMPGDMDFGDDDDDEEPGLEDEEEESAEKTDKPAAGSEKPTATEPEATKAPPKIEEIS